MSETDPIATAFHPTSVTYFGELLAPPDGMVLEQAIATTFTLDLETALIPPLMTLGLGTDSEDARRDGAKLALNLRHAAERMTIFMEAGHLSNYRADEEIHVLLAPMLREVLVPGGKNGLRSFHPKVWAIHFKPLEGKGTERLRLVVSSRNLTRSMSRDAMVVLEGAVGTKKIARNAPVAEFIRALPVMVVSNGKHDGRADETKVATDKMAALAERTSFRAPPGFKLESFSFAGPGQKAPSWLPQKCSCLSVISPFCDADTLNHYETVSGADELRLVSRQATLDSLQPDSIDDRKARWTIYAFDEAAGLDEQDVTENAEESPSCLADRSDQLHAKIYIEEGGRSGTRLTIGSGNATNPAREGRNVEFYATLITSADQTPLVPSFDDHENTLRTSDFGAFLKRYEPADDIEPGNEEDEGEFDPRIRFAIYELLNHHFSLSFELYPGGDQWVCRLVCDSAPNWNREVSGLRVRVKPAPAHEDAFVDITNWSVNEFRDFIPVPAIELSPFMNFELARDGVILENFTTQLPHQGFPENIHLAAVMRRRLPAASDWLGALMATLNGELPTGAGWHGPFGMTDNGGMVTFSETTPLLETLVAHLDKPEALMAFARTLVAFGDAVSDDAEVDDDDDRDKKLLEEKRTLYRELKKFWQAFESFLPDQEAQRKDMP